jgi:pyruvate kinase
MAVVEGVWRTVGGRRIYIAEGQSLTDAMKSSKKFNDKEVGQETKKDIVKVKVGDDISFDDGSGTSRLGSVREVTKDYVVVRTIKGLVKVKHSKILERRK